MYKKKLIEVALPLEAINIASSREKSIRHGHPSTLHLWWARRPLATARAVIWSSLVDDPSSHPEEFPTEEAQEKERDRLFKILVDLVQWENSNNELVLSAARAEIMKSTNNNPPPLLDPFAGGGSIPLEAQRLGLEAHASDLNPVAVMINKAMIEIPPRFAGMPPVNPEAQRETGYTAKWKGAHGLAEDVRYYGEWMKQEAFKRIGHLYPKVKVPQEQGGGEATVFTWIWARTIKCPNPACKCRIPLSSSYILSIKKGNEAYVEPLDKDSEINFTVRKGKCPKGKESNKVGRSAIFICPVCGETTTDRYVKQCGQSHDIGNQLMAIVAEGNAKRIYLSPVKEHILASEVQKPESFPDGTIPTNPRWFSPPIFGLTSYSDLFTNRQLTTLTTFSELISQVQTLVEKDAVSSGLAVVDEPLSEGGSGAKAYSQAICVYLAFVIDKMLDYHSTLSSWHMTRESIANALRRQALPMVWDFTEVNPFCNSAGSYSNMLGRIVTDVSYFQSGLIPGVVKQHDAQSDNGLREIMISTDPPYYDNIGYADLSDFFYVWMRDAIKDIFPKLFRTMLVPKAEELIATPYRFGGSVKEAREFFEQGMLRTCEMLYQYSRSDTPVTIFYAFKQSESDNDSEGTISTVSSGWETMLNAIITSGFSITGTWPMRTELTTALKGNINALASSIVLVCRKRPVDAPISTRRDLVATLKRELRPALTELQRANIAPVDLAQSAIGPGIGVYSRYSKVLEADGSTMNVRSALTIINQELDSFFSEQDGALDSETRFCISLYTQFAFNSMKFSDADVLARAKNTSTERMASKGVLYSQKGSVHLLTREELPSHIDDSEPVLWLLTQQLTHAMTKGGIEQCARVLLDMGDSNGERAKALAYRLYTIAERKGWAQEAFAYNSLVVAWPDIQTKASDLKSIQPTQGKLFD